MRTNSIMSDVLLGRVMVIFNARTRFLYLNHFSSGLTFFFSFFLLLKKEEFYDFEDGYVRACVLWNEETV